MNQIQLNAMAKINLGLDVVGRRPDGYHELRMVMQMVNLYDRIEISVTRSQGVRLATNLRFLPTNENNLAYRAAQSLIDEFHIAEGVHIKLDKHIPVSAGMGGGSSDAATVLYGVNRLFKLGLSKRELMERGVRLGADVPYCLLRSTALSEGIGEILTPLPPLPKCAIVIAKPRVSVSTRHVFERLDLRPVMTHPDIDGIVASVRDGDLCGIAGKLGNTLEEVTARDYPVIGEIKEMMVSRGALGALMSGSGPTVFGIFDHERAARGACSYLKQADPSFQVFLTRPVNASFPDGSS